MLIDIIIFDKTQYMGQILTRESFNNIRKKLINKELLGCINVDVDRINIFNTVELSKVSHRIIIKKITKRAIIGELKTLNTEHGTLLEEIMKHNVIKFKPVLTGGFNMWNNFYVKDIVAINAYPVRPNIKEIRIKKLNSIFGSGKLK
jgi:hypothetical protein